MAFRNLCRRSQRFLTLYSIKTVNNFCRSKTVINVNIKRNYQSQETFNTETDQNELEVDVEIDKISLRNLLYPNSKDPLILELNESASVQNVFDIIRKNHTQMNPEHISQAVLVLWDLQKIFYKYNMYLEKDNSSDHLLNSNAIIQNYMDQVNSHEDFEILIKLVEKNYKKFSLDALTCTLLYLNRMGVKINTNVIQLMIVRCEEEIKNCDIDKFPLSSLSRFIVTIYSQECLLPIILSVGAIPIINRRLNTCTTEEDFKLLTICMHKMIQLISNENLESYKKLSDKLIDNNIIVNPRTILKAIRFLNHPQWFEYNTEYSNKFIHLLKGSVKTLSPIELISLFKVFQIQKEPAIILEEIQNHASNLLEENLNDTETTLDLISCIMSFSSPLQRPRFEKLFRQYVKNDFSFISLLSLYKILYYIKTPDYRLCNYFWDKSLNFILNTPNNKLQNMINLSYRYMHFTNNVGYRYRYYRFEKTILNYFNHELNSNILTLITNKFTSIASFIIIFTEDHAYVEKLFDKLLEMSDKFNSVDCLNISRSIQTLLNNNIKDNNLINKINLLNNCLNDCIENELMTNSSLPNVNVLLRNYIMRQENIQNKLYTKLLNCYTTNSHELTSRIIRDTVYNLQVNNCLAPQAINEIINYIINKQENILGNTLDKVLYLCYTLGYVPKSSEEFLNIASKIIMRDKDRFSGLSFLQSCLSLCYFNHLPDKLIKYIFSVDFMEKIDEELSNCYSKTTYPTRVRDHLMQLNRAVCLDYPQFDVPWFHQKYIDDNQKYKPKKDFFYKEVLNILTNLTQELEHTIIEDSFSPYGYHIDFELQSNQDFSKTAILLLNSKTFTSYISNIKGYYQLKQRHLEILGYNTIEINYSEWKSFYSEANCKQYIKNKIKL